jgi:hypothetical protein
MFNPKAFDVMGLKPFCALDKDGVEIINVLDDSKLANVTLGLKTSQCQFTAETKRRHAAMIGRKRCAEHLGRLPVKGESVHCIFNGEISLWDFVGATLELSGNPIDELLIATLGFSDANAAGLDDFMDEGKVKSAGILCSHFFAAKNAKIYEHMCAVADKHKFPIAAMRSHAKVMLMRAGKARLVVESSSNLRSCHNIEQATFFNSADIYEFHETWIRLFIAKGLEGQDKNIPDRELRDSMQKEFH